MKLVVSLFAFVFSMTSVAYSSSYDQLSVGTHASCALKDRKLNCWGGYWAYKFNVLPIPSDVTDVLQVSVASHHACALTVSGVKCWGDKTSSPAIPYHGEIDAPENLKNPTAIMADAYRSCAVTDEGVVCWGNGSKRPYGTRIPSEISQGRLCAKFNGVWDCPPHSSFQGHQPSNLGEIKQLAPSYYHTCALTTDSEVKCWGRNGDGESTVPKLNKPTEIATGEASSCALTSEGVVCWGNDVGWANFTKPPKDLKNPRGLEVGVMYACVDTDDGIRCWGSGQGDESP